MMVSVSVSLRVRTHISETARPNFTKSLMHVACGQHDPVVFWRRCNALCSSGFLDDVMFFYNDPMAA